MKTDVGRKLRKGNKMKVTKDNIFTIFLVTVWMVVLALGVPMLRRIYFPQPVVTIQGPQGLQGIQGEKGSIGAKGLQGEKGDTWYNDLPKLYKQTSPAVVWIGAKYTNDEFLASDWREVYRKRGKNIPITVKWQGSGFLVNADGLIATAGHVCEDTKSFIIQFQDGTRGEAEFVHMEKMERCDVGFLQITRINKYFDEDEYHILLKESEPIENLPYFNLDTEVEIGENLIILGHPWGLNTGIALTQGVVSLSNREELFFGVKLVMHVDVASYPGNSGSPVINMDGEVVGILIGGRYGCDNWSIVTRARLVELAMQKALAEIGLRETK